MNNFFIELFTFKSELYLRILFLETIKIRHDFQSSAVKTQVPKVKKIMTRLKFSPSFMKYEEI